MTETAQLDIEASILEHHPYRTRILQRGTGPLVILLHGSGPGVTGRANWYTTMTSPLAEQFTFVAPDIIGFGETEFDGDIVAPDHDGRVTHVIDLLQRVSSGPVRIIGNSMGGGIALAVAHRRPDLVDRMILMGSAGVSFPLTPEVDQLYGYVPSVENMRGIFEMMAYDQSLVTPELIQSRYEATLAPGAQERFESLFPPPRQRHIDDQALSPDALAAIDAPTLLIHGAFDRIVPLESAGIGLVRSLPNADLAVLGRCGHWAQAERGDEFRRLVAEFMQRDLG
jgi:pimeloyl-ACP methyl ester carboxylesterase